MGKKKTLIFLLIIPLLVALISYVGYVILRRSIKVDISDIRWNYSQNQAFRIGGDYLLEAEGVYDEDLALDEGNDLVWSLPESCDDASIEERDGSFYLVPESEGSAIVTCSNRKGSVSKSFNAIFYADGTIVVNPVNNVSGNSIDGIMDYGEYEFSYSDGISAPDKVRSTLELDVTLHYDADPDAPIGYTCTDNVTYDPERSMVSILSPGLATIHFYLIEAPSVSFDYSFNIVEGGVNIRDYTDLLYCTNWAETPTPAVLQVNLGSLKSTYVSNPDGTYSDQKISDDTELFGNYDFASGKFSFEDEVYRFETTYFTEYLDQYNAALPAGSDKVDKTVIAGIHLTSDLYGNGFSIDMNNLCYPNGGSIDSATGKLTPGKGDLFKGPVPFMGLGDLEKYPIVAVYGQDNCGVYIDADGVTVDDVTIRNASDTDNLYNYTYCGSVIDVEARDVTISNSVLANGKNIVRAFSADGLSIDNCTLKNGAEFLLYAGSNRANSYDDTKTFQYFDGSSYSDVSFSDFFDGDGDASLEGSYNSILRGDLSDTDRIAESLQSVQGGLDNTSGIVNSDGSVNYDSRISVKDTNFYTSGVYSIALDAAFNGGYMYNGAPSIVKTIFQGYGVDLISPEKIGHTSYPVEVTLEGDTRFYDFKSIDDADLSTLIEENITALLRQIGMLDPDAEVNIDDYFPLKDVIRARAEEQGYLYSVEEDGEQVDYINTQVAWYGGGLNLSNLVDRRETLYLDSSDPYELDFVHQALEYSPDPSLGQAGSLIQVLRRAVFMAMGTHSFRTITNGKVTPGKVPPLFGQTPPALTER